MGGHGHGEPYKVPHYSQFSSIEGIKELEELEKALSMKGLKDPWIRNEAWRYHPGFGTKGQRARLLFCRGMPLGILLGAATAAFDYMVSDHSHGHGHHEEKPCK